MPFSVPPVPERVMSMALRISPEEEPPEVKAILRALLVGLVPSPVENAMETPSTPSLVAPRPLLDTEIISTAGAVPEAVICTFESASEKRSKSPAPLGTTVNVSSVPVVISVPPADCEKTSGVLASNDKTISPVPSAVTVRSSLVLVVISVVIPERTNPVSASPVKI